MFLNKIRKKILKRVFVYLTCVLVAVGLFYGGFRLGIYKSPVVESTVVLTNGLDADSSLFSDVVSLIKEKYVGIKDIKDQDLLYGAIGGLVNSLGDEYSIFLPPSDAKKFEEDLSGSFGGIGARLDSKDKQILVLAPLKNSPAEDAGLQAGDIILKVNDTLLTANSLIEDAVKLIRGEPGTEVRLSIFRDGWLEAKEFKIIREIIEVPTLDWEVKDLGNGKRVAYIQLYNFNSNAPSLFYEAALATSLKGIKGIVFDLRNNPGGYLDAAVNISSWFIDRGEVVVVERFRGGEEQKYRANGNQAFQGVPVVLLMNAGSASASEIVAGALRDARGIKIVGEKTFGKGSVQEVANLKDGSSLKVSIAEWFTPLNHAINKIGIAPDVEVNPTEDDIKNKKDVQLEKALEIIKSQIR